MPKAPPTQTEPSPIATGPQQPCSSTATWRRGAGSIRQTAPVLVAQTAWSVAATVLATVNNSGFCSPGSLSVCAVSGASGSIFASTFSEPAAQSAPAPTAMSVAAVAAGTVRTTAFVAGSIRDTVRSFELSTHTEPAPTATSVGEFPTAMSRTTPIRLHPSPADDWGNEDRGGGEGRG